MSQRRTIISQAILICFLMLGWHKPTLGGGFHTGVMIGAGSYPESVVVGDVNNDGKPDLVFADGCGDPNCLTTGVVSVLLGNGDGTFQAAKQYVSGPSGTSSCYVAAGDFNGDGALDLVVVNNAINRFGTISVLLGNGDGSFQAPVSYSPGPTPVSVVVGDFNHDGALDLAVVITSQNYVSILLGLGDGTFGAATTFPVENGPQGIAAGDFNGDGHLDLAVANECGTDPLCETGDVSILLGNGDGTFQLALNAAANSRPLAVEVGDFNNDG